jgi:hypothetical protein
MYVRASRLSFAGVHWGVVGGRGSGTGSSHDTSRYCRLQNDRPTVMAVGKGPIAGKSATPRLR